VRRAKMELMAKEELKGNKVFKVNPVLRQFKVSKIFREKTALKVRNV
jgi:hypothetical protein